MATILAVDRLIFPFFSHMQLAKVFSLNPWQFRHVFSLLGSAASLYCILDLLYHSYYAMSQTTDSQEIRTQVYERKYLLALIVSHAFLGRPALHGFNAFLSSCTSLL